MLGAKPLTSHDDDSDDDEMPTTAIATVAAPTPSRLCCDEQLHLLSLLW